MIKEIKVAIQKKQVVTLHLIDGEVMQGIPESCTDRVKIRSEHGAAWVPVNDVIHVTRIICFPNKIEREM